MQWRVSFLRHLKHSCTFACLGETRRRNRHFEVASHSVIAVFAFTLTFFVFCFSFTFQVVVTILRLRKFHSHIYILADQKHEAIFKAKVNGFENFATVPGLSQHTIDLHSKLASTFNSSLNTACISKQLWILFSILSFY